MPTASGVQQAICHSSSGTRLHLFDVALGEQASQIRLERVYNLDWFHNPRAASCAGTFQRRTVMVLEVNDAGELVLPPELVQAAPHTRLEAGRDGEAVVLKPIAQPAERHSILEGWPTF